MERGYLITDAVLRHRIQISVVSVGYIDISVACEMKAFVDFVVSIEGETAYIRLHVAPTMWLESDGTCVDFVELESEEDDSWLIPPDFEAAIMDMIATLTNWLIKDGKLKKDEKNS